MKPAAIDVKKAQEIIFQANPGPQADFLAAPEQEVLYGGAAGGGKMQPTYSQIATPYGWKTMGDISVGDIVSTPDGGTSLVTQVHEHGVKDVYTVTMQDGSTCEAGLDHLWYAKPIRDGKERWKVVSTEHLLKSKRTYVLPLGVVEREETELPLDPYVLGSLLGDGCISTRSVSFTTDDMESVEELRKYVEVTKRSGKYAFGVLKVASILKDLNLLGTNSHTKFIPENYLNGSIEQRRNLLQGLMDTDGYVSKDGKVNFTSMSPSLRAGVAELVRSLGGTAKEFKGHSLYIRHPDSASLFRLKRKRIRCHPKTINNKILRIEKTGQAECRCITISSKEQLYVTDNYIVTHNSYALVADPLRSANNPYCNALLVRRTTEELRELKAVCQQLYPKAVPGCRFDKKESTWYFPAGGKLWLSYLDNDDDLSRYQGQAFTWIGFDELTHWPTARPWDYLRSRLRTTSASGIDLYQRATTNPGGVGHYWVKKMFIDPSPPGKPFWATDIETGKVLRFPKNHHKFPGKKLLRRRFIPATLFDNPYLADDGMYEANLLSLPEHERIRLLEGNWDIAEGAAFPEFNRKVHVIEPFDIPQSWTRFRACDYGYGSHTGVLWFAVSPDGDLYVYRELYVTKVNAVDLAYQILDLEGDERISYGVLDSSLWHNRGDTGPSLAEQMIIRGCRWRPSDRSKGSRVAGKNELHRRLQIDEYEGKPTIYFFETCTNLINQLPSLPLDKRNPEDVDTNAEDHLYDALRYGIMTRPRGTSFDFNSAPRSSGFQVVDKTFGY